jgi:hypothetical protein
MPHRLEVWGEEEAEVHWRRSCFTRSVQRVPPLLAPVEWGRAVSLSHPATHHSLCGIHSTGAPRTERTRAVGMHPRQTVTAAARQRGGCTTSSERLNVLCACYLR